MTLPELILKIDDLDPALKGPIVVLLVALGIMGVTTGWWFVWAALRFIFALAVLGWAWTRIVAWARRLV